MSIGRLEIWVATLIGVTVDVNSGAGEATVMWTLDITTIGERELYILDRCGNDSRREPITVVSADLILTYTEVEVIVL